MSSRTENVTPRPTSGQEAPNLGHPRTVEWPLQIGESPADPHPPKADGEPYIGSSLAPSILGVDLYGRTPADAYDSLYKLNDLTDTPAMFFGRTMEAPILHLWEWAEAGAITIAPDFARHPFHPFMGGHADAIIHHPDGDGIGEVKCLSMPARFSDIRLHGPPEAHVIQVMHLCLCYGLTWGKLIYYSPQMGLMTVDVQLDIREKYIIKTLHEFWIDHYQTQVRPTAPPPLPTDPLPPIDGVVEHRDDDEFQIAVDNWLSARTNAATARKWEVKAKVEMKTVLGNHGVYEGAGVRIYFQQTTGRITYDVKALLKHKPVDAITLATELLNEGMTLAKVEGIVDRCRMKTKTFQREGEGSERLQSFPIATE